MLKKGRNCEGEGEWRKKKGSEGGRKGVKEGVRVWMSKEDEKRRSGVEERGGLRKKEKKWERVRRGEKE